MLRSGLVAEVLKYMCGGIHCGEVKGLVSMQRWSHSRGATYMCDKIHYGEVEIWHL